MNFQMLKLVLEKAEEPEIKLPTFIESSKKQERRRGTTEDEMVGWHHKLNGDEFEQAPGVGAGRGSLACSSPWDRKELDTTELN